MKRLFLVALSTLVVSACGVMPSTALYTGPEAASLGSGHAVKTLSLGRSVLDNRGLEGVVAKGPGRFDNALALNVQYAPIRALRSQLDAALGGTLSFFKLWNPEGEAHVTVINPPEYYDILAGADPSRPILSIERIGQIAAEQRMQEADLRILGLGSGHVTLDGKAESTYFVLVESKKLRAVRRQIHREFVARGGNPNAWDPEHFFPHITVGYTKRDLHEVDGVLKDVAHSLDKRFKLKLQS